MSLLLQALKKAEEDKRRRAALASDLLAESTPPAGEFPALNLLADEVPPTEPDAPMKAEAGDWDFVPLDVAAIESEPISAVQTEPVSASALAIENTAGRPVPVLTPPAAVVQPTVDLVEAAVEKTPAVESSSTPSPVLSAGTTPSPIRITAQPQMLAKNLFAKSKNQPARGLLPWLLLGAGLLLAGMVAWFAWQYRQLTQPIPKVEIRTPIAVVASSIIATDGYIAEGYVDHGSQANTHVDAVGPVATPMPSTSNRPEKINAVSANSAVKAGADGRAFNPPLTFVRQSPHFAMPDPVLLAWQFYQEGDLAQAELFYRKALLADPRQRDAALGLAAIAQQRGDLAAAEAWYQRILRANPQDDSAKAALLMLNSAQLPEKEAVQLEQSGQSDPMVMGQYFAAQQRWSQAQEQFFLAYTANPNSADAAFNLAVSLDHLQQNALAKTYYRKALQLKESSHFDRSKIEQRLAELDGPAGATP